MTAPLIGQRPHIETPLLESGALSRPGRSAPRALPARPAATPASLVDEVAAAGLRPDAVLLEDSRRRLVVVCGGVTATLDQLHQ